ncbi:hypothetical protein BJ875DRAFT_466149 [Amylocarpus encephaloides]|uniref:RBR-type E3 ubiquitin transferase n=1 Tax=Amylocarpus encephaloides TaxID=45428 RepID=A0A9P7YFA9_9HELO|nr:hypothetical protein BJ875DRAFT_466149 [Amylocarpus encephaloides]
MATAVATMPGRWLGDVEVGESTIELLLPPSPIIPPKSPRRAHISNLAIPASPIESIQSLSTTDHLQDLEPIHDVDELFFNVGNNNEAASPSYLIFEPVVSSVSNTSTVDWKRYEPPQELLISGDDTPLALRGLLAESVERIKVRHREEEEQRAAAARRGKPLRRGVRASVKPKHEPVMSGALDPTVSPQPSRSSMGSGASIDSLDSGYGSRSPNDSDVPPVSSPKGERSFLSGLASKFKRRDVEKRLSPLQKLGEMSNVLTRLNVEGVKETAKGEVSLLETTASGAATVECVSCLDDFEAGKMVKLTCHSYCAGCFQRLVNNAMESETHWPVKCCLNIIPISLITPYLLPKTLTKFQSRSAEWSIPAPSRIYCSSSTCSIWLPPSTVNTKSRLATCPSCATQTCTTCRGSSHKGIDCPEDPALLATLNLAEMEGWKRCYSCNAFVEHNQGCRHMTCRCKAQFCYICGLRWRTCECADAQLAGIQTRAATRRDEEALRTARTARARAAEEEERENLRIVEEFIRQEAEREAAALAAERRRAEQRQRAEEQARRQAEEARVASLRMKYARLDMALETLHDFQRTTLVARHESENTQLSQSLKEKLEDLSLRHAQESQLLALDSQTRISDLEHTFKAQYHSRLLDERRAEDQYLDELIAFWRGKDGGEVEVRKGRDELRVATGREFAAWNEWWRGEVEACREAEAAKRGYLEKKHVSERNEVEGRGEIDDVELGWKREAEGRWVDEVVGVRWKILGGLERDEVEEGGGYGARLF